MSLSHFFFNCLAFQNLWGVCRDCVIEQRACGIKVLMNANSAEGKKRLGVCKCCQSMCGGSFRAQIHQTDIKNQ